MSTVAAQRTQIPRLRPLAPQIGVEIQDIDLSQALDENTFRTIEQAWFDHGILLFRNQQLSEDQQVEFARRFGELGKVLHQHGGGSAHHPCVMFISNIRENGQLIGALPDGEMMFHSDQCYMQRPSAAAMLYGIELPSKGGNTIFANMYAAWDSLPQSLRQLLEHSRAVNVYDYNNAATQRSESVRADAPRATHPVARTHPATGRKALYVNRLMTESIVGLPAAQSRAVLDQLFDHAENPAFQYEHIWRKGDLMLWDNRCTQHARTDFDASERRLLRRCVVLGEIPQ